MRIPKRKYFKTKEFSRKNKRRFELIDKLVDAKWGVRPDGLTKEEQVELEKLEDEISEYIEATCGPIVG